MPLSPVSAACEPPVPYPSPEKNIADPNKLQVHDRAVHDWYRFVLSFPPHLVRDYLQRFNITPSHTVLDPFCGTGTVIVECKKLGIRSVGVEAHPMAYFASEVKTSWSIDSKRLVQHAERVAAATAECLAREGIEDNPVFLVGQQGIHTLRTLSAENAGLLLAGSISPLPLHKALVLLERLADMRDEDSERYELLALARVLVNGASNLHFGPEVGIGPPRPDAPVIAPWLNRVRGMAQDLHDVQNLADTPSTVLGGDSREISTLLPRRSIDAVITSPPYPNEKDYTRTMRLESVLLNFVRNKTELRALKRRLVRSNTRGVYKGDNDYAWVANQPEVQRLAHTIEERRVALKKTSGFERMYARVTRLYFGGMARHLAELRLVLRPGARLAYVVGDQASYLRVMIRTGQILAEIARGLGYEVVGIDLFRSRLATATREQLREEVVVLRWPGD